MSAMYDFFETVTFWAFVYYKHKKMAPRKGEKRVFTRIWGSEKVPGEEAWKLSEAYLSMAEQRVKYEKSCKGLMRSALSGRN